MKYLTVTTPGYRDLTKQMIASSGVSDWDVRDMGEDVGVFRTPSFNRLCRSKPRIIYELLKEGHEVFSLDGDVIFLEPLLSIELNPESDIQGQCDPDSGICCGFCHYRPTKATMLFFERLLDACEDAGPGMNEQLLFNQCLRDLANSMKVSFLHTVYSFGLHEFLKKGKTKIWEGEEFDLPSGEQAFHANYVLGIDAKRKLLNYVKSKI